MEKDLPENSCIICGQEAKKNDIGGIHIRGGWICADCEEMITVITIQDPGFEEIRQKLKKLWTSDER